LVKTEKNKEMLQVQPYVELTFRLSAEIMKQQC